MSQEYNKVNNYVNFIIAFYELLAFNFFFFIYIYILINCDLHINYNYINVIFIILIVSYYFIILYI